MVMQGVILAPINCQTVYEACQAFPICPKMKVGEKQKTEN
jgi:hypothetical protein